MEPRIHRFQSQIEREITLQTLCWGDRGQPLLVLLHGGGANAHWWDHIAPEFARTYHVVALDFRGHGDSTYPKTVVSGAFGADLESVCQEFGTEGVTLMGHSMGARVAMVHAARVQETRRLVLVDPARSADQKTSRRARLALSLRLTYLSKEEAAARFQVIPASNHMTPTLRKRIASHSVVQDSDGRWGFKFDPAWFAIAVTPPPDLAAIRCPTLVLRGEESTLLSVDGAQQLCAAIPEARWTEIPGAGHHIQLDQPEPFLEALRVFLNAPPRRERPSEL